MPINCMLSTWEEDLFDSYQPDSHPAKLSFAAPVRHLFHAVPAQHFAKARQATRSTKRQCLIDLVSSNPSVPASFVGRYGEA